MKRKTFGSAGLTILIAVGTILGVTCACASDLSALRSTMRGDAGNAIQTTPFAFDGYTNHWKKEAWNWHSARGLFLTSKPTPQSEIWAMESEVGKQFLIEELWIEPGFLKELSGAAVKKLNSPSREELEAALSDGDVLVSLIDRDPLATSFLNKLPEEFQFRRNRAFLLRDGSRRVFVLASHSKDELRRLQECIDRAVEVVRKYDLYRGMPGISTNFLHITPGNRHNPFALVDTALGLGCSWLTVKGFNDWMLPDPVNEALAEIGFSFPFVSGQYVTGGVLCGMENYPDVQDNTVEECLDWAEEKGGYYFASLAEADNESATRFHGYILASPSEQGRIEELDAPFVTQAGDIGSGVPPTMVVFLDKGTPLTQTSLMEAILAKRAVGVFGQGKLAGPPELRDALRILLLERVCLEEALEGPVGLDAVIQDRTLGVTLRNLTSLPVRGNLRFQTGETVTLVRGDAPEPVELDPNEARILTFPLHFTPEASGRDNLVGVVFAGEDSETRALAHVDLPKAVEMHPLILDAPGEVAYPITVSNYTDETKVTLKVLVTRAGDNESVFSIERDLEIPPGKNMRPQVSIPLEPGDYLARATAIGVTTSGQVAIRAQTGTATAREEDLDGDGVPEIVMENDRIRATVLLFGGRVIEYIVKNRDENLLFKLWPEKPPRDGEVGGTRSFYPYGGLEEFTGYPYIGGHIVFKHEIVQASGPYVRVRVWANIHGSKIEKTVTLFAGNPVLEVRYAMDEVTPTLNVIGINPLFQVGPSTGPEDRYYFPEEELVETIPEKERYYGRAVFPKEGWAAGYDTEMDISLAIGYPVDDAIYLHLWNNHPDNTPTPYYYTEIQPWLELKHGTTTYFSYYLYGQEGLWKPLVEDFKALGLLTERGRDLPWSY
jgi:hypothetical protein